jgi:hypothetical protein
MSHLSSRHTACYSYLAERYGYGKGLNMKRFAVICLLFGAIFALPGFASAGNAVQLEPVYIDRDNGFVYFIVQNRWDRDISKLYGWVYGYGLPKIPGIMLTNNPHSPGMKVSLGGHIPGSSAMYRFKLPEEMTVFPQYSLVLNDDSVFHSQLTRAYR